MSLDTVPVAISAVSFNKYIHQLNERDEVYSFNVETIGFPTILTLHRDGCEDPLYIMLQEDGTWSAHHVLVVGEKQ